MLLKSINYLSINIFLNTYICFHFHLHSLFLPFFVPYLPFFISFHTNKSNKRNMQNGLKIIFDGYYADNKSKMSQIQKNMLSNLSNRHISYLMLEFLSLPYFVSPRRCFYHIFFPFGIFPYWFLLIIRTCYCHSLLVFLFFTYFL